MNFYNEIDPFAAAWLRELIKAGHIAPGVVDERSIEDLQPDELKQYTQCHFFAGIGVWSYALRCAGWPDDRPVWTGSCPCQPFSTAGKRTGTADERHLWPAWFHLIEQCRPSVVFGEQVEAAIRQGWLDLVQTDLEGCGYTFGASGLPASGFGAPHIRQRLYFVADTSDVRCKQRGPTASTEVQGQRPERSGEHTQPGQDGELSRGPEGLCSLGDMAHTGSRGHAGSDTGPVKSETAKRREETICTNLRSPTNEVGNLSNFWTRCEYIPCRDGKARPVEPGTFPLAHGATNRVGRLRGYGNAIVAPVAEAFIRAYLGN